MTDAEAVEVVSGPQARDALVERLNDPETVATLLNALDVLPTLAGVLQILEGFIANSERIVENIRESVGEVAEVAGASDLAAIAPKLLAASRQSVPLVTAVADSGMLPEITDSGLVENLAESGLLRKAADPGTLALLGTMLDAVAEARAEKTEPRAGVLALTRALRDPDTTRGIDFALRVMNRLGAALAADGH